MDIAEKMEVLETENDNLSEPDEDGYETAQNIDQLKREIKGLKEDRKEISDQLKSLRNDQVTSLKSTLDENQARHRQEDILSQSLIAWNDLEYNLFQRAVASLDPEDLPDTSFYHYLQALSAMVDGSSELADRHLSNAMLAGPYALEPVILRAILLGADFDRNEHRLDELAFFAENHFDSGEYQTGLKLTSLYFRLGGIYFQNGRYEKAKTYFEKAHSELGVFQRNRWLGRGEVSNLIRVNIANTEHELGNIDEADETMDEITEDMGEEEAATFMQLYVGSRDE
ncbi:MAG: tetratricopeptide repeat protein [Pseudomonadota bacterium]